MIIAVKIQKPPSGFIHASRPTFLISFNVDPTSWVSAMILHHLVLLVFANKRYQFVGVAAFQRQNIDVMDDKCIVWQLAALFDLVKRRRPLDAIAIGYPVLEAYRVILWPAAFKMIADIIDHQCNVENPTLTGGQIVEAPLWLTKSKDREVPFLFPDFGGREARKMWIVSVAHKILFLSNTI